MVDSRSQTNRASSEHILASATVASAFSLLREIPIPPERGTLWRTRARRRAETIRDTSAPTGRGTGTAGRHDAKEVRKRNQSYGGNRDLAIVEKTKWKRSF